MNQALARSAITDYRIVTVVRVRTSMSAGADGELSVLRTVASLYSYTLRLSTDYSFCYGALLDVIIASELTPKGRLMLAG